MAIPDFKYLLFLEKNEMQLSVNTTGALCEGLHGNRALEHSDEQLGL